MTSVYKVLPAMGTSPTNIFPVSPLGEAYQIYHHLLHYLCMADPEVDHGFIYDHQGLVDILQSSFFDLNLEVDNTVDDYVDRILFTLAPSIAKHLPFGRWRLIGHPPVSSSLVNFPWINTLGVASLLVAFLFYMEQVTVQRNSSRLPADQPVWRPSWAVLTSQIAAHNIKEKAESKL
ncbi:hypothetical protein M5K25_025873 [Dendrobium thyrsiflorum]|uniref:Uncharacterized protein n=1 Tax=Dendrobium thyrsiflorum TaxID=117978 RepID=A0ABD0TW38_DENTH